MYNPPLPADSPIAKLMLTEDKLLHLTPVASTDEVTQQYE